MENKKRIIPYNSLFRASIALLVLFNFFLYGVVDHMWSRAWADRFRFLIVCVVLFLLFKQFAQRRGMTPAKNRIISGVILAVMAVLLLTSNLLPL